jgi:hypothetical protein
METVELLNTVKELTLDFVNGKSNRAAAVKRLRERIAEDEVYDLPLSESQRDLIIEAFVSLDNLTNEEFAPSLAEMRYFAEVFEGKRAFSQPELRKFPIGSFTDDNLKQ